MLPDDIIVKNYSDFKERLINYVGENYTNAIVEYLGGDDAIMDAPYGNTIETGLAYRGSLVETLLNLTTYAIKLNQMLPKSKQVEINSIVKVGLLHQLAKVLLYIPNDNNWEINNRGIIYKYNTLEGALRVGERSALIASNAGVKFTELEYEAMKIMDKNEDDNYSKFYASTLSMLIKHANEIIMNLNKKTV